MNFKRPFGRDYYYVIFRYQGKLYVWGAYKSESEANTKAYEKLRGTLFEIMKLGTSNLSEATRIAKSKNLESTGDLDSSLGRASHLEYEIE